MNGRDWIEAYAWLLAGGAFIALATYIGGLL